MEAEMTDQQEASQFREVEFIPADNQPVILSREDAKTIRQAIKAGSLAARVAAFRKVAPQLYRDGVWEQVLAHVDGVVGED